MNFLKTFLRDEQGASAAEYALILALVGAGIAVASITLGGSISQAMTDASECIDGEGDCAPDGGGEEEES